MGNCINSCRNSQETETKLQQEEGIKSEKGNVTTEEKSGNMRVKIVLTKDELDWLLFQLKDTEGKRLEDVLGEIQRSRERVVTAWKPSLDSITEIPEVSEIMNI